MYVCVFKILVQKKKRKIIFCTIKNNVNGCIIATKFLLQFCQKIVGLRIICKNTALSIALVYLLLIMSHEKRDIALS